MIYRVCTSELLGYQTKIGSILLIIFLIPASLIFHNPIADPSQINAFLKNIGLIGGLSILIYAGSGALSIDGKKVISDRAPKIVVLGAGFAGLRAVNSFGIYHLTFIIRLKGLRLSKMALVNPSMIV